jgi:homoserine kinase
MPDTLALIDALRAAGHPAVVSGAGPTVLVPARGEVEAERILEQVPDGWVALTLPVDAGGATVISDVIVDG